MFAHTKNSDKELPNVWEGNDIKERNQLAKALSIQIYMLAGVNKNVNLKSAPNDENKNVNLENPPKDENKNINLENPLNDEIKKVNLKNPPNIDPFDKDKLPKSWSKKIINLKLYRYIQHLNRKLFIASGAELVRGAIYLKRFLAKNPENPLTFGNMNILTLLSLVLSEQIYKDCVYADSHTALQAGIPTKEYIKLKNLFITMCDYHFYIHPEEFEDAYKTLLAKQNYFATPFVVSEQKQQNYLAPVSQETIDYVKPNIVEISETDFKKKVIDGPTIFDETVDIILEKSIAAINKYLKKNKDGKSNFYFWSTTYGRDRVQLYKNIYDKHSTTVLQKLSVIYAIVISKEGSEIKADLSLAIDSRNIFLKETINFLEKLLINLIEPEDTIETFKLKYILPANDKLNLLQAIHEPLVWDFDELNNRM